MQTSLATRGSSSLAARPAAAGGAARCRRCCLRVAADKGFSGDSGSRMPKQVKKSKRGKVASRPSPKLTLEQLQADQQQYEEQLRQRQAAASAPSSSAAAGDDDSEYELQLGGGGRPSSAVEYGSTAAVPEVVTDRMLKRVIIFMGTPVFGGVLLFPLFYYLKVKQGLDLPNWVAYLSSSLTFGGGLLGISYGIMSASWDPRREGSLLGWTEFQANLPLLLDRFRRGSD